MNFILKSVQVKNPLSLRHDTTARFSGIAHCQTLVCDICTCVTQLGQAQPGLLMGMSALTCCWAHLPSLTPSEQELGAGSSMPEVRVLPPCLLGVFWI